ncbi:hypothetical protein ERJ75_001110700 [Trypanosoma vivax]|nr:hypothetical protein ERJ75_001110700 [Trypanosoma vivax]
MSIGNAESATRREPGTAALSSPDITLCRDCEVPNWNSTLSPDSDHYWITFDAFVGTSLDVIAPSNPAPAPHAWNKARWNEFRKLSDEFIFRRMKRSAKGADAMNEAVTLTGTLCKLMERIVARRAWSCVGDKLKPQQAGFSQARSTPDTLMEGTGAMR